MRSVDYAKVKIDGLHYVREVSDKSGQRVGYLLIDNKNKPVKQVYKYLLRCKKKDGYEINTLKRICYDLQHFYDYMLLNRLSVELITYEEFHEFIKEYLKIIDPKFRTYDCIERSMLDKVPILEIYSEELRKNVVSINKNDINTGGLTVESIKRIVDNVKNYLIYLVTIENVEIGIEHIFSEVIINVNRKNRLLGHIMKGKNRVFTANNILRAAGVIVKGRKGIEAVEYSKVFEDDEIERFMQIIKKNKNIMYYLFFYILKISGARISEIRALQIWNIPQFAVKTDLAQLGSDIKLVDKESKLWRIEIKIREDNPSDLQIKSNEGRNIDICDKEGIFEDLLNKALMYRKQILRKKRKESKFLFINRNGDRFLNPRVEQVFKETMIKANLRERLGRNQLVPHSFRHTYSSGFIKNLDNKKVELGLRVLSSQLGHRSIETTRKTYIHFFKNDYIDILKSIEENRKLCKKD